MKSIIAALIIMATGVTFAEANDSHLTDLESVADTEFNTTLRNDLLEAQYD